jgi:hypothetical protein
MAGPAQTSCLCDPLGDGPDLTRGAVDEDRPVPWIAPISTGALQEIRAMSGMFFGPVLARNFRCIPSYDIRACPYGFWYRDHSLRIRFP